MNFATQKIYVLDPTLKLAALIWLWMTGLSIQHELNLEVRVVPIKVPVVYIMANEQNGAIYIGVTSNLQKRVYEHKNKLMPGFTKRFNCNKLVFFKIYEDMESAICEEKRLKGYSRQKKAELIEKQNPQWSDLYEDIIK